jgi:hypothetical protein
MIFSGISSWSWSLSAPSERKVLSNTSLAIISASAIVGIAGRGDD